MIREYIPSEDTNKRQRGFTLRDRDTKRWAEEGERKRELERSGEVERRKLHDQAEELRQALLSVRYRMQMHFIDTSVLDAAVKQPIPHESRRIRAWIEQGQVLLQAVRAEFKELERDEVEKQLLGRRLDGVEFERGVLAHFYRWLVSEISDGCLMDVVVKDGEIAETLARETGRISETEVGILTHAAARIAKREARLKRFVGVLEEADEDTAWRVTKHAAKVKSWLVLQRDSAWTRYGHRNGFDPDPRKRWRQIKKR